MTKATRRLKNFNFKGKDAHIALVDRAANGQEILVKKNFSDKTKFINGKEVKLEESGLMVGMSLEDVLMMFTDMFPEKIETLTNAIMKSANGSELLDSLEEEVRKNSDLMPFDQFAARKEKFEDKIKGMDKGAMLALRAAADLINEYLDRGIKPGDSDSTSTVSDLVEKTMTDDVKKNDGAGGDKGKDPAVDNSAAEELQKSLDEKDQLITKQAERLERLEKAEEQRISKAFTEQAEVYKSLGLPEAEEGKDAVAEFGEVMKTLASADQEAWAKVESVLNKAVETLSKGEYLEQSGSDGEPPAGQNAESKLDEAANKLMDEDKTLTKEAAITKALESNPELYEA